MNTARTHKTFPLLVAAAAAAALTYFFDSYRGKRRRSVLRDKMFSVVNKVRDTSERISEDLRNRTTGMMADVRTRISANDVPDHVLCQRIRAKLGRVVSHPGAIQISAHHGTVTLRGQVPKREVGRLLIAVRAVPGTRHLTNQLQLNDKPNNAPSPQATTGRHERKSQASSTRLLLGIGGGILTLYGLKHRTAGVPLLAAAGIAMLGRAVSNDRPGNRLLVLRGWRSIDIRKEMHIDAPVDQVFDFWGNFENFSKFMRNVRNVRRLEENLWRWEVAGPLGATIEWDARVTEHVPNRRLAWETAPGAHIQHTGAVHFQPQDGGTRIEVQMSYNPAVGAFGHAVTSLFGSDPQKEISEDLVGVKSCLETSRPVREAARASSPTQFSPARH